MRFHLKTYGCQMNVRDADAVGALLMRHGLTRAASERDADVILVNTCSVRGKAESKALGKLGLLVAGKRDRPGRIVGAMGCMVQRLGADIFTKVPGLDFAVGTRSLSRIPALLERILEGHTPVLDIGDADGEFEALAGHAESGVAAFVNILFGCDRRCAYCIVPDVRGREWSRAGTRVVDEVRGLTARGVKEVTLLGQSVMSYGRKNAVWPDDYHSPNGFVEPLSRLLEAVDAVEGLERIRFTSGHASGCTPELARAMCTLPHVCEHLHIPVQSGSDRILSLMRRGYTTADYREAVDRLRERMPNIALTTDIIVGFPTETETDFEHTREFMEEIGFDNAFVFKYSPRPGTKAADMADDVPNEEKVRRNQVLLEDQDARGLRNNTRLVGQRVEVLVEGTSLRNETRWSGRTRTNRIVVFDPSPGVDVGVLAVVEVDRAMPQTLYGKVID